MHYFSTCCQVYFLEGTVLRDLGLVPQDPVMGHRLGGGQVMGHRRVVLDRVMGHQREVLGQAMGHQLVVQGQIMGHLQEQQHLAQVMALPVAQTQDRVMVHLEAPNQDRVMVHQAAPGHDPAMVHLAPRVTMCGDPTTEDQAMAASPDLHTSDLHR